MMGVVRVFPLIESSNCWICLTQEIGYMYSSAWLIDFWDVLIFQFVYYSHPKDQLRAMVASLLNDVKESPLTSEIRVRIFSKKSVSSVSLFSALSTFLIVLFKTSVFVFFILKTIGSILILVWDDFRVVYCGSGSSYEKTTRCFIQVVEHLLFHNNPCQFFDFTTFRKTLWGWASKTWSNLDTDISTFGANHHPFQTGLLLASPTFRYQNWAQGDK